MNTGSTLGGRPSLGAWVTYGLGTENEDLPAFVVMKDKKQSGTNGVRSWGPGFLPAVYQGTPVGDGSDDQIGPTLQVDPHLVASQVVRDGEFTDAGDHR